MNCGIILGMKRMIRVKTSVTLPPDLLADLDRLAQGEASRSRLIEEALRDLLDRRARAQRNARDLEILNRHADRLNDEAADVLDYQVQI
jgi:metal-responsive CopG/Arc/MetJ family transcriptional regulator